jgi:hypothetical protein
MANAARKQGFRAKTVKTAIVIDTYTADIENGKLLN